MIQTELLQRRPDRSEFGGRLKGLELEKLSFFRPLSAIYPEDIATSGGKAVGLGNLIRKGHPVPEGVDVTTDAHTFFKEYGVLPDRLVERTLAIKDRLGGKVAMRSSANIEDGKELSMAGVFVTDYVTKDEDVEKAYNNIYDQASSDEVRSYLALHGIDPDSVGMSIVVQELIVPDFAGVIYTGRDRTLIQYSNGFGANIVDGETHGSALMLDSRTGQILQSVGYDQRPIKSKLVGQLFDSSRQISADVEGEEDIEFATREDEPYILQDRPLTTQLGEISLDETPEDSLEATKVHICSIVDQEKKELGTNTVVFSDTNFSELLPRPTEMDFGVFAYIFTGSDGVPGAIQLGRRQMGYPLGDESIGLMHYIGGRPYSSIARDAGTFYAGFPDTPDEYFQTLVPEYTAAINADPSKGSYPEMGLYLQDPTHADLQTRFGDRADAYYGIYRQFLDRMDQAAQSFKDDFATERQPAIAGFIEEKKAVDLKVLNTDRLVEYAQEVLEHMRTVSCVDFVKSARLGFYYAQRLQAEIKQIHGLSENDTELLFARLNQGLEGSLITDANLAIADAQSEDEATEIARKTVGHYSTAEMLEIRHPRLKDDEDALRGYAHGIQTTGTYRKDFDHQKEERERAQEDLLNATPDEKKAHLAETIDSSQTYMALRETIKYQFTQEYALLGDCLEVLGERLGLEKGDIYYVFPREIPKLAENPRSMQHLIDSRKRSFEHYPDFDMPSVVRESDIDALALLSDEDDDFTQLSGKFLSDGEAVSGTVVNLDEFGDPDDARLAIEELHSAGLPIILVSTQLNLSHDPFIAMSDGIIIQNAGIVSHGAQRARELGKGAIGGIKARRLKTGMSIELNPGERLVKKIKQPNETH